jgi:hypothetical protein
MCARPLCIEDLPNVALSSIFVFSVSKIRQVQPLVSVCKRWQHVLRESPLRLTSYESDVKYAGLTQIVAALPRLAALNIMMNSGFTDEDARTLAGLSNLRSLSVLPCPELTGEGLVAISKMPKLRHLDMRNCAFEERDFSALGALANLKHLRIYGRNITDAFLMGVARLTNLRSLYLEESSPPGLKKWRVSDEGVLALSSLRKLAHLTFHNFKLTKRGLKALRGALPKTRVKKKQYPD